MLKIIFSKQILIATIAMFFGISTVAANSFNAYPGNYKTKLVSIEQANIIYLSVGVWAGYPRVLRISLPDIVVPKSHADATACQIELAQKAMDFTNDFISESRYIEVRDIHMENTGTEDATSNIYTDSGSLAAELTKEGLARPASVDATKPWC